MPIRWDWIRRLQNLKIFMVELTPVSSWFEELSNLANSIVSTSSSNRFSSGLESNSCWPSSSSIIWSGSSSPIKVSGSVLSLRIQKGLQFLQPLQQAPISVNVFVPVRFFAVTLHWLRVWWLPLFPEPVQALSCFHHLFRFWNRFRVSRVPFLPITLVRFVPQRHPEQLPI